MCLKIVFVVLLASLFCDIVSCAVTREAGGLLENNHNYQVCIFNSYTARKQILLYYLFKGKILYTILNMSGFQQVEKMLKDYHFVENPIKKIQSKQKLW